MRPVKQRLREIGFKKGHKYFSLYSNDSNDATNRCSLKFPSMSDLPKINI